ncbi:MAG: iron ABC transporter permease [Verrucomicrobiota bacterium]|jgi:iron(III) transport system permease protein|nr:MAG: iron ABC transporter permease [Verrucomicrobiota bacterium]
MSRAFARFVLLFTAVFFAVFFFWPLIQILKGGFINADGKLSFSAVYALLGEPLYLKAMLNSVLLATTATVFAFILGLPLAYIAERFEFAGRKLFSSLVLVPLILPAFVGAIGIRQLLGQAGALNSLIVALHLAPHGWSFDYLGSNRFIGVALVDALSLYPLIMLNAAASLAQIDPSSEEAAENLGCTGFRRFFKITLPLIKSGLFAGGTLVFIWAFTDLGTPLVFDYFNVTPVQIYQGLSDLGSNPYPYALVAIMLTACLILYSLGKGVFGNSRGVISSKSSARYTRKTLSPLKAAGCTALFLSVTLLAILPHLCVVLIAFSKDWYGSLLPSQFTTGNISAALSHNLAVSSIANSLKYASVSTFIDLCLGVSIAYVIVRSKISGRKFLDLISILPLAVPGLVLAFGYLVMAREGSFFSALNPVRNPTLLLIIAYSIRRLPYVIRTAVSGFEQTSETLEEAAQNLGTPPLQVMLKITLPLISANLIAGAILAFSFAMLEVSDSLILAQKQTFYPITKAIMELFQLLGDGKYIASALGSWAMLVISLAIIAVSVVLGKKLSSVLKS